MHVKVDRAVASAALKGGSTDGNFTEEELTGGSALISVKELAKWNRARGGDESDIVLLHRPIEKKLEEVEFSHEARKERRASHVSMMQTQAAAHKPAAERELISTPSMYLGPTRWELPMAVTDAFRLRSTSGVPRRAQSPKKDRLLCNYPKHALASLTSLGQQYTRDKFIEPEVRMRKEKFDFERLRRNADHRCVWSETGKGVKALGDSMTNVMYQFGPLYGKPVFDDTTNLDNMCKFYRTTGGMQLLKPPGLRFGLPDKWVRRSSITGQPVDFSGSFPQKLPHHPESLSHPSGHSIGKSHHDPMMTTIPCLRRPGKLREVVRTGSVPPDQFAASRTMNDIFSATAPLLSLRMPNNLPPISPLVSATRSDLATPLLSTSYTLVENNL